MREMVIDGLTVTGIGLVGAGCWWAYPPAALIVVGSLLLAGGVSAHFRRVR